MYTMVKSDRNFRDGQNPPTAIKVDTTYSGQYSSTEIFLFIELNVSIHI